MTTRWLDRFVTGFMLVVIGAMMGLVWSHIQIQEHKEAMSNEQRAMSNELKEAERKLAEMEEEIEHQKLIKSIAMCESSLRHDGIWGDGGKSYGLFQFQRRTFYWLAGKISNEQRAMSNEDNPPNPPLLRGNKWKWKDARHQYVVASWAIKNGYGDLWTCYKKLTRNTDTDTNKREG